jgi:hypothetical protein
LNPVHDDIEDDAVAVEAWAGMAARVRVRVEAAARPSRARLR